MHLFKRSNNLAKRDDVVSAIQARFGQREPNDPDDTRFWGYLNMLIVSVCVLKPSLCFRQSVKPHPFLPIWKTTDALHPVLSTSLQSLTSAGHPVLEEQGLDCCGEIHSVLGCSKSDVQYTLLYPTKCLRIPNQTDQIRQICKWIVRWAGSD